MVWLSYDSVSPLMMTSICSWHVWLQMDLQWASNELLPFLSQLPSCHIPFSNNNKEDVFRCQLRICLFIRVVSARSIDPGSRVSPASLRPRCSLRITSPSSASLLLCSRTWATRPAIFCLDYWPDSVCRLWICSPVWTDRWCEHVQSVPPNRFQKRHPELITCSSKMPLILV